MTKTALYHERPTSKWRGGTPWWWFGAPFIAMAYVLVTPRFLPDIVSVPSELSGAQSAVRWLVGLVVGVVVLATVRGAGMVAARRRTTGHRQR
jgi:hypothetical protein